ncbi:MAG: flagellar hook-basal body complex protein FliE [Bacillota bacterium]|nr:flagellar hook-basal body complex protein FliE [Bacillota bacterium]
MKLEQLGAGQSIEKLKESLKEDHGSSIGNDTSSFLNYLKGAMGEVDQLQKNASTQAEGLAIGEGYLHNTFIAYEKANLALQLTVEIRNRIVEAYQEIMRMQV